MEKGLPAGSCRWTFLPIEATCPLIRRILPKACLRHDAPLSPMGESRNHARRRASEKKCLAASQASGADHQNVEKLHRCSLAGRWQPRASHEQDITGTYTLAVKNPDGSAYSGVVTITGTAGGNCGIKWVMDSGQVSEAFCMRQDEVVGAAYLMGSSIGMVIYRINAQGGLDGTWSIAGQEGVGEERLVRKE